MAGKQNGLGDLFLVGGYDMSGDTQSLERIGSPVSTLPTTGIDKRAMERIVGRIDGEMGWRSYFNKDAAKAHQRYKLLPKTDVINSWFRGSVLGGSGASMVGLRQDYAGKYDDDGGFMFDLNAVANSYGLEWCTQGTAGLRTDTSATNGTSIDLGAATAFGLQAYLHVKSFTGTSCTVTLQGSSDNGVGDAFANITGAGFTAATAIGSERIQTTRTQAIERYIRVATAGTFSECTFAVQFNVNPSAQAF